MAERKRSTRSSSGGGRRSSSSSSRSGSPRAGSSGASSSRKAAARKGGQARGRQQRARSQAQRGSRAAAKPAEGISAKTAAELREALRKNLIRPLDLVMLTRDRIEEALGEAVERGQITAKDARGVTRGLVDRGRKQTNDVLKDLEQLMGRGRDEIEERTGPARTRGTNAAQRARKQVEGAARGARSRAVKAADPALARADRVRRAAGVGPNFPITAYEDLTAAQVQSRLGGLTAAELRKVRDHERRNANRKSVLSAIETKLGR